MPQHNCLLDGLAVSSLLWQDSLGAQSALSTKQSPTRLLRQEQSFLFEQLPHERVLLSMSFDIAQV